MRKIRGSDHKTELVDFSTLAHPPDEAWLPPSAKHFVDLAISKIGGFLEFSTNHMVIFR